MKKIFLMALSALLLFSCSEDYVNIPETTAGDASLYLSISMPKTKALMDDPTSATMPTTITTLIVKAYNASDVEVGSNTISGPSLTTLLSASGDVAGDANQLVMNDIDVSAAYIRIWAYHANKTATNIVDSTANINNLQVLGFDDIPYIANTPDGKVKITKTSELAGTKKKWTAIATIQPYLARFEVEGAPIAKSSVTRASGSFSSATINVIGIYMNNIKLDNQAATLPTLMSGNNGNWEFNHANGTIDKWNSGGNWEAGYYTSFASMFDGQPKDTGYTFNASTPSIWTGNKKAVAYNLYTQKDAVPHLVLSVTVDKDGNSQTSNDQFYGFITISKFKDNNDDYITGIINGNLYQVNLNGLEISEENITPDPEMKSQNLYLKLTVIPWNQVTLTPEL